VSVMLEDLNLLIYLLDYTDMAFPISRFSISVVIFQNVIY